MIPFIDLKTKYQEWELAQRQIVAERYRELLVRAASDELTLPWLVSGCTFVYAQFTLSVSNRDEFCERLNAAGIPTAVNYAVPLHLQPTSAQHEGETGDWSAAQVADARVASQPTGPNLNAAGEADIVENVMVALHEQAVN